MTGPDFCAGLPSVAAFTPDTRLPCRVTPSPNHGDRRGRSIRFLVLHYTGMASAAAACARLCDPDSEVSSHYLVDEAGGIEQLVPEERRAWHAGRSYWRGERDLNSTSIGIEIANAGHDGGLPPFPETQIASVIALCRDISQRRNIAPENVLGHSDIAPDRKADPGERFPWEKLAREGVGLWPERDSRQDGLACASGIAALQRALASWGYDLSETGTFDAPSRAVIRSFQRRFRPNLVTGEADRQTVELVFQLLNMGGGRT